MSLNEVSFVRAEFDYPDCSENSYLKKVSFRVFDLSVVILLLPIIVPAILVSVIAIKLADTGAPPIFRQTRYGLYGKPFKVVKLRTMVTNADTMKVELLDLSADKGQGFKIRNDPRVTRIGSVLRRSYLDELPQFLNVLRGEMSVVGPRPNSYHPSTYEPWQLKRLEVKPGLTGDWQVSRNKSYDFCERCRIDNDYVDAKSIFRDVSLIFRTAKVCLLERSGL